MSRGFIVVSAVLASAIGGLLGYQFWWNTVEPAIPVDPIVAASNKKTLEKCRDLAVCMGGFVKWRDGTIGRIAACAGNCRQFENDIVLLLDTAKIGGSRLQNIEYIVLPNEPPWATVAMAHAQQFVERR